MRRIDFNEQRTVNFNPKNHLSEQRTQILLYRGLDFLGQYIFSSKQITIGRGKEADIILEDPRISEIQAAVYFQNDNLIISDRSDRLSVYLNGKPVKAAVLEPFDLIEIGDYSLKINLVDTSKKEADDGHSLKKHTVSWKEMNVSKKKSVFPGISEEIFNFSSRKKQKKCFPGASSKPSDKKRLHVSGNKIFPEEYFKAKDNYEKEVKVYIPDYSEDTFEKGLSLIEEEYSEDFFNLPPYKVTEQSKSFHISQKPSMRKKDSDLSKKDLNLLEDEEYTEDFFKLPPYKTKGPLLPDPDGGSDRIFSGGLFNKDRPQNFDPLSSNRASNENTIEIADRFNHVNSPESPSKRYNLIFSGKLKPGYTLLDVKVSLNRRFGIEYRRLGNLFLNRQVVLKRNVTHEKALKLYHAFDVSGAICTIVSPPFPPEDPPEDPDKPKREKRKKSDSVKREKKSRKLISIFERSSRKISKLREDIGGATRRFKSKKRSLPGGDSQSEGSSRERRSFYFKNTKETGRFKKPNSTQEDLDDWEGSKGFTDKRETHFDDIAEDKSSPKGKIISFRSNRKVTSNEEAKQLQPVKRSPVEAQTTEIFPPFGTTSIKPTNILSLSDFWKRDEDEDEDDSPAEFRLKDKLVKAEPQGPEEQGPSGSIEVIKLLNHTVVDVSFLNKGQKYIIHKDTGRKFKLVEHRGDKKCFYYLDQQLQAQVETSAGLLKAVAAPAASYRTKSLGALPRRQILPSDNAIRINDGCFEYKLRQIFPSASPKVTLSAAEKRKTFRHVLHSAVFHIFLLLFMGFIPWNTNTTPPEPESRFVRIDPNLIAELEKPEELPQRIELKPRNIGPIKPLTPPPPPPPEKKLKSPKTIAKVSRKKPVVNPKKMTGSKQTASKTVVASTDRHPDAGGGAGKGNVVNRDIKQVGLLSMIGDSVSIQPQAATAAVTNLDAVASPGAGESNFKVGGIAAKLGTGKISMPSGGYVATKGSTQVLRSTGASGPGRVAALERGNSGEKQVKGMVSAKMTRKVNIRGGGMSREAVKRVIDQHLDEISYCYEVALIKNPAIMGRITYEWKIKKSGDVGEVNIKSATINSHDIHACIKNAIKSWKFPQPQGSDVVVSYPFIFDIVGF